MPKRAADRAGDTAVTRRLPQPRTGAKAKTKADNPKLPPSCLFAPRVCEITVVIASLRQVVSTRARHEIVETLSAHAPARSSKLVTVFVTSSTHLRPLVVAFPACHFLELRHHRNNGGTVRQKKCILVGAPNCEKSDASSRPLRLRASVPSRSPPQFTAQLIIMR